MRIYVPQWRGGYVYIRVYSATQPDGITLLVPSYDGVIVAEIVVEEVCFLVRILPRESERELERSEPLRILIGDTDAERLLLIPAPYRRAS